MNQRRRTQEDRPDVFDHLAQLRRKQHRFEEQRYRYNKAVDTIKQ